MNIGKRAVISVLAILLLTVTPAMASVSMPSFALKSVTSGKTVSSESFEGKVLLVTFFATWCPPCRQEIPTLIQLQNELKEQSFSVLGLSVDEGGSGLVAKLVKQNKINYPILMADAATAEKFGGIPGIPTSFLINRQGNVVKSYPGYVPHKLLKKDIEAVMK